MNKADKTFSLVYAVQRMNYLEGTLLLNCGRPRLEVGRLILG